jgi:NADH-quinone oxidoreductase subunit N
MSLSEQDLRSILPALALILGALVAAGVDAFFNRDKRSTASEFVSYAAIVVSLITVVLPLLKTEGAITGFQEAVTLDGLALFLTLAILAATGLMIILSADYLKDRGVPAGEFHGLVLFGASGMILLVQAQELITFFIALEILSLSVYILSGLFRKDPRSNEAAVKYFVAGAFATGFLLYGMAFLYGVSHSLRFDEIAAAVRAAPSPLATLGFSLIAIGLAFKVGTVPFHMWVADVYEGAPTSVTAFMSVSVKAAGFGAFVRLLLRTGMTQSEIWGEILGGLALATMIVGNLMALSQRSVKRMLAYSSVAHTGYVLVALASLRKATPMVRDEASAAAVFYLFAYTFMTLGAFAFIIWAGKGGKDAEDLDDYAGLARRRPWAALAMTVFMISLAGIPPAAGFFAKFLVFKAAVAAQEYTLVIVGVLSSAVSVYYYLRVAVYMYMHEPAAPTEETPSPNVGMVVIVSALFTLYLGLLPGRFLEQSYRAISGLVGR